MTIRLAAYALALFTVAGCAAEAPGQEDDDVSDRSSRAPKTKKEGSEDSEEIADSSSKEEESADTETPAKKPTAKVDPVMEVWNGTNYLPWTFAPNGCYARAYYVTMELAVRGVAASQQIASFMWMKNGSKLEPVDTKKPSKPRLLFGGKPVRWDYHVAALLLPPVVKEPTILDRAMEAGPVPVATWLADINSTNQPKSVRAGNSATDGYNEFTTWGSTFVGLRPDLNKWWDSVTSPTLADAPAFNASDVQFACDALHTVIECVPAADNAKKQAAVKERTNELLAALEEKGLVKDWDGAPMQCKKIAINCGAE